MTRKQLRLTAGVVTLLALIGATGIWWARQDAGQGSRDQTMVDGVVQDDSGKRVLYWHDPMVPGKKFDQPGKSPFMDMQLVPKYAGDGDGSGIQIAPGLAQNLGIRIGTAARGTFGTDLQALGRVAFDEHDIRAVQTRAGGFIERLYVRAVGDRVTAGQKVAEVYAPELLAAQNELLALNALSGMPDLDALKAAARERLKLLGMNAAEIDTVEKTGAAHRRIGVYSPIAGIVQELGMREGAQVMPGQTLLQVAGLNRVWVVVDLPERDLGRVRNGQAATIRFDALSNASFTGKIQYIYPKLDQAARTGQVRIQLANPKALLRPGMYAQVSLAAEKREALTVPSEAIIATGTRAVVIVRDAGGFRPADVKTGIETDGRTEILAGLKPGEEVVLSGQFLIDSEASLKGVLARLGTDTTANAVEQDPATPTIAGTGTVKEVDAIKGTVTLAHGPIPALQWPAMTMTFKLRDPGAASALKPGTHVSFALKREPEGSDYIIESFQPIAAEPSK